MAESAEFGTDEGQEAPEGHDEKMAAKYEDQDSTEATSEPTSEETTATESEKETEEAPEKESEKESEDKSEDGSEDKPEKEQSTEDFDKYSQEYAEKGELSEETYQELQEKYNISKEVVDRYIQNQHAAVQAVEQAGYAAAGGQEQFQQMAQWARQNLSESEIQEFNKQVNSQDPNKAVEAVNNLKSKYTDAVGQEPALVEGEGNTNTAPGYQSRAEMTRDMRDPRYHSDPAFRAEVERKLKNSTVV